MPSHWHHGVLRWRQGGNVDGSPTVAYSTSRRETRVRTSVERTQIFPTRKIFNHLLTNGEVATFAIVEAVFVERTKRG